MKRILTKCPACNGELQIIALKCPECGMELRNTFALSPFERLSDEQQRFLMTFLRKKGNLFALQTSLGISYPTARKQLNELLSALDLLQEEEVPMQTRLIDAQSRENSLLASDLVRARLEANGGRALITTLQGKSCEIRAKDAQSFSAASLPFDPRYEIFDIIVELLLAQGGTVRKGNGHKYKLGEPGCDERTVVGVLGKKYFGAEPGTAVLDPVFVLGAVLAWAGLVHNERGVLRLTADYQSRLTEAGTYPFPANG